MRNIMLAIITIALLTVAAPAPAQTAVQTSVQSDPAKPVTTSPAPTTPAAAEPEPIRVDPADVQAITQAARLADGLRLAMAVLQEKLDAANAAGERASERAQAKHPDMPINPQTWTYGPAPKKDVKKDGGAQ